jgi:WD40-like Beta Propeller Repeat
MLTACGGSSSQLASHSPGTTATPSSVVRGTASPVSGSPSAAPPALVHCTTPPPAGDNLVIGTVVGDSTVVVRDIQDPANARNVCTFDPAAQAPQFVSAVKVAYETADNQLISADLTSGATTVLATFATGFGSGQYSVSPDGRSVSYIDVNSWRLKGPSGSRVLSTLPAAPGRGVIADEDDTFLRYSPDGRYIALFQTFHVGGAGETAPDQIRRASDGSLAYSTSGMTMAVWASAPSRLLFRDSSGGVHRWDPSTGLSAMIPLHWIRPQASPDGRWIAYTVRTSGGVGEVGFYSVQSNSVSATSPPGRSGVRFLSNDLAWYAGERACSTCFGGLPTPTGATYIYDLAGAAEVTSRLSAVFDLWPR